MPEQTQETKDARLWSFNHEPLYRAGMALAARAIDVAEVAKGLREIFEQMPEDGLVRRDVGSLDEVDWMDVGREFWDDAHEDDEDPLAEEEDEDEDYEDDQYYSGTGEMMNDESYERYLNNQ